MEKFVSNSANMGKNNINKELNSEELNEKPICSNILKIVIKNKRINTYSKIIKDIFPKILQKMECKIIGPQGKVKRFCVGMFSL